MEALFRTVISNASGPQGPRIVVRRHGGRTIAIATIALLLTAADAPPDRVFTGACDGSAVAMLSDGRLVVGDDETGSLHIYPLAGGAAKSIDLSAHTARPGSAGPKYEPDIEAAARVGDRIYWIASHGRNDSGKAKPDRQLFFATSADPKLKPVGKARHDLFTAMLAEPDLAELKLRELNAEGLAPKDGGLNIEALAAGSNPNELLIGFRSPRAASGESAPALVIPLTNARDFIAAGLDVNTGMTTAPRFGTPIALNLGGLGLRDMVRKPDGSYVILAGPVGSKGSFAVYSWKGPGGPDPVTMPLPIDAMRPEAITVANGKLVILSDDGEVPDAPGGACKDRDDRHARRFIGRVID